MRKLKIKDSDLFVIAAFAHSNNLPFEFDYYKIGLVILNGFEINSLNEFKSFKKKHSYTV